jgi:hypothetical protein
MNTVIVDIDIQVYIQRTPKKSVLSNIRTPMILKSLLDLV